MSTGPVSWNDSVIADFLGGTEPFGGRFTKQTLLLLGTTGARSGQERTSPVAYQRDGDRLLVAASAAGRDQHPAWYHNLVAHPEVRVRIWDGDDLLDFRATATAPAGAERDRLFAQFSAAMPGFADYQTKTARVIPIVVIERATTLTA